MITIQHSAVTFWGMFKKLSKYGVSVEKVYEMYNREIPWVLLPDAIRNVVGPRQAGHHEKHTDGVSPASWMKFPDAHTLKTITKENVGEKVCFKVAENIKKCVIGEYTDFDTFNVHNIGHAHYHSLAIHLGQDDKLDYILREDLIDPIDRFEDEFVIRHSGEKIDGKKLREQVALLEEYGFIKLVGLVYQSTGHILNKKWFEDNVYAQLCRVYPDYLAESAWGYMKPMLEKYDERISALNFELTEEEKKAVVLTSDLDGVLSKLYSWAYWATVQQI